MLPTAKADDQRDATRRSRPGFVDARHHVRLGLVDELVRQPLEPVGQRPGAPDLHLAALGHLAGADQLDDLGDRRR